MKIIIAGSRSITSYYRVEQAVAGANFIKCSEISEVISGNARGVDTAAKHFAYLNRIPLIVFPANWKKYGNSAGYRRNLAMSKRGEGLIAIWDGESKGTYSMINIMREAEKPVHILLVR